MLVPGLRSNLLLDTVLSSHITRVTFESLSIPTSVPNPGVAACEDEGATTAPNLCQSDRSFLTPRIIRYLLCRYERCVRPQYDIFGPETLSHNGDGFRKLPNQERFKILMACAIAAARESWRRPAWKSLAYNCREWANELFPAVLSAADAAALQAVLLLLIYELTEPSRGLAWQLLDFAKRTCLQLGWCRAPCVCASDPQQNRNDLQSQDNMNGRSPQDLCMLSALTEIEV